jgi:hypothetical protein
LPIRRKTGHYDGYDTAGIVLHFLTRELQSRGHVLDHPCSLHAADLSRSARTVLLANPELTRPKHIFTDIAKRLPQWLQDALSEMESHVKSSSDDRNSRYAFMLSTSLDYFASADLLSQTCTAYCAVHQCQCPVYEDMLDTRQCKANGQKKLRVAFAGPSNLWMDLGLVADALGHSLAIVPA